eukprot:gb/GECH01012228.1/.p1 GENE.gb/GECH01012228.1/~~gb/GECH01012228.1/.p1  ORF type:complete len:456 (+),score=106.37 gb/GECH01012228.1/:1-1368(+)
MSTSAWTKYDPSEFEEQEEQLEPIDWSPHEELGTLTKDENKLMKKLNEAASLEGGGSSERLKIISGNMEHYVTILSKLSDKVNQPEQIKYVLTVLSESLRELPKFCSRFHEECGGSETYSRFLRRLSYEDLYIKSYLVDVISSIWVQNRDMNEKEVERVIDEIYSTLRSKTDQEKNSDTKLRLKALSALMRMLRSESCRLTFERNGYISILPSLLDQNPKSKQVKYEVAFCLWMLTFSLDTHEIYRALKEVRVVPKIHSLLIHEKKEKVVRVSLYAFRNLIRHPTHGSEFIGEMINVSVPKTLKNLSRRKFEDDDITNMIEDISETVEQNIDKLTSFSEYRQELYSKNLEWSPSHTSDKFWRENLSNFESQNFKIVGELVDMLHDSNKQNVAIALHDLGQFVRFHPIGKKILEDRFNAKPYIMGLMEDEENSEVKKQALLCTQKLMVRNWSHLAK